MSKDPVINGVRVRPGENQLIDFNIAKLPSGTAIDLPVYMFRSKNPGPSLLLIGGLHGDEINGVEIIRRMIASKIFEELKCGSVIAVPVLNIYGFLNFSREVPDGKDINRNFPGSQHGSLAAMVAHFMTKHILPQADYGLDFHTGGAVRYNYPQVRYAGSDPEARKLAVVFKAPLMLQSGLIDRSLRKQAHKTGVPIVVFEGGESMRIDEEVVTEGIAGTKRVMHYLGMRKTKSLTARQSVHCSKSSWIRAKSSGIFNRTTESGTYVKKGDEMGRINDPFNTFCVKVKAPREGFVVGHNNMPVINRGDALFHLGYEGGEDIEGGSSGD